MRIFNTAGLCVPDKHYMVDISGKLAKIMEMIDKGDYFTINRARQYGKTTTLLLLARALPKDYTCISLSFEGVGDTMFASPASFCQRFLLYISKILEITDKEFAALWKDETVTDFDLLGYHIEKLCVDKKIVLMIDEVDKMSGNEVFLHFLGMLRSKYLSNQAGMANTFHSVILTGVYDIKNIKLKMINEGAHMLAAGENKLYNSPWNIAADFEVDMSFNPTEIATMLKQYDADHNTGMDIPAIAAEIYRFSGGYPYLVSRICKQIDRKPIKDWTLNGVQDAVNVILGESNTLFDDLYKNLENNAKLYDLLYDVLMLGRKRTYAIGSPAVDIAGIFGIIKEADQSVSVSNKIFELAICNYFIAKNEELSQRRITGVLKSDVVDGGRFDMELCMRKFAEHYAEIFNERDAVFIEREGRLLFLSYLKPLINGQGFYHIESQFTDLRRMDVAVDFGREQFIVELKLWKGEAEHKKAYEQLAGYLRGKGFNIGYLLTFDLRKNTEKQPYAKWVDFEGKRIFDVIVC